VIRYLDTSAALKLVIDEPESTSLAALLNSVVDAGDELISSMLLFTELHCAAGRRAGFPTDGVTAVLDSVALVDVTRADLLRAATSAWGLRSADAIHLATALRLVSDTMLTYDAELSAACRRVGITVEAPQ
jgi:predicted nucleic acid-binding protein